MRFWLVCLLSFVLGYFLAWHFVDTAEASDGSIKTCRYISRCDGRGCRFVRQCCENKLDPVTGEWYRDCWVE